MRKFGTSRPTVARAMHDLEAAGLLERRPGWLLGADPCRAADEEPWNLDPLPWRNGDLRTNLRRVSRVAHATAFICCGPTSLA